MEAKVKKLENEVIRLRDELAKMKRFYEDLLYNLDDDNFSSKFLKEKNGMKTAISVTEEGIKTLVQKDTELGEEIKKATSSISQTAEEIKTEVSKTYETKDNALENYTVLSSRISQTSEEIALKVSNNQFETYFKQTANGFTFDGNQTRFSGVIYLTDEELNNNFSFFYKKNKHDSRESILLHSVTGYSMPIVIGDGNKPQGYTFDTDVFIGNLSVGNEVATRGWIQANPQPAVFG